MHYDFFKELHEQQLEMRSSMLNDLSFLMIPYGLALGVATYYVNFFIDNVLANVCADGLGNCSVVFSLVLLGIDIMFLAGTGYYMIRAYHDHEYEYLASADELANYYAELKNWHAQQAQQHMTLDDDFQESLIERFVSAATRNYKNNKRRRKCVFLSARCLILSVPFLLATLLPFTSFRGSDPTEVRIINPILEVRPHAK